ncbi:MAG TPA: GNAT family N-acetyltransferase [Pyrinomonadaceae bacterium]|nr:GNAT family N-acetyltransferase [Pyrinomonadaceae bacterium]
MEYRIRLAKQSDVPHLPGIEQRASELFASTPFAVEAEASCLSEAFHREQVHLGRTWVAADVDNMPVAFATLIMVDGRPHLHELSVDPAHGRRGLGRKLVETVCERAKTDGHPHITLSTYKDVPWNAPFYERSGFQILDDRELGTGMKALRNEEKRSGLDIASRVVMIRDLTGHPEKSR